MNRRRNSVGPGVLSHVCIVPCNSTEMSNFPEVVAAVEVADLGHARLDRSTHLIVSPASESFGAPLPEPGDLDSLAQVASRRTGGPGYPKRNAFVSLVGQARPGVAVRVSVRVDAAEKAVNDATSKIGAGRPRRAFSSSTTAWRGTSVTVCIRGSTTSR